MLLTTVLIVLAASGLILLVILELMREVVILRSEVSALTTGVPLTPSIGHVVELDSKFPLSENWFVISLVSRECPACADLARMASELFTTAPGSPGGWCS